MKTDHLELVPHAPWHILALNKGPDLYEKSIGFRPAQGLREFIVSPEVSPAWLAELYGATGPDPWVWGFAVVHSADRAAIGVASFKGPPTADGLVEIAYGIVPEYQSKGFATEAAQALVTYALASNQVRVVRAHTSAEVNASGRVLTKCGFTRLGEVIDPDDGQVWRWEKRA